MNIYDFLSYLKCNIEYLILDAECFAILMLCIQQLLFLVIIKIFSHEIFIFESVYEKGGRICSKLIVF